MIFWINKVYEVIIVITIYVSFVQILNLQNFNLMSLKNLVGPVGNIHDLEITLHEILMPLIHIDLYHQVHLYGGRPGSVTL